MFRYIKNKRANSRNDGSNHEGEESTHTLASSSQELHHPSAPSTASHAMNRTFSGDSLARVMKRRNQNKKPVDLAEQQRHLDESLAQKLECLANFDFCIEQSDSLAAAASSSTNTEASNSNSRRDPKSSLVDCSVLVSPDGDLLIMPQQKNTQVDNSNEEQPPPTNDSDNTNNNQTDRSSSPTHFTSPLTELGEEYESAIFVGNDLDPRGDKALNGFSANGWSIPAASLALRQTEQTLHDFADFCEEIVLSKKESATRNSVACDKLMAVSYERGPLYPDDLKEDAELLLQAKATKDPFELTHSRVGPMLFNGGSLHAAHVAVEEFYNKMAESESQRWRLASLQRKGALPPLRKAATRAEERSANRQKTLRETYVRVQKMEDHLADCKYEAQKRWKDVQEAEEKVNTMVAERMMERNRQMEAERLKEFHKTANGQQQGNANSAEIWDIVSQVTASMENGSFEPIDFPHQSAAIQVQPSDGSEAAVTLSAAAPVAAVAAEEPDEVAIAAARMAQRDMEDDSRMELEEEMGLPGLRTLAFAADRLVQDASSTLLNVLSSLDQIRRSARISAETNLLSACNAQADCIRSMVKLERAAVDERLKRIEELERIADKIDVRRDINTYINEDRKRPGGSALLGQDDDGGIASALAVLTSHVEGDMDMGSMTPSGVPYNGGGEAATKESVAKNVTPEALEEALEQLFVVDDQLEPDAPESAERDKTRESFNDAVRLLCDVAIEKTNYARPRRSRMCYALNAKRGSNAEIKTPIQFDSICKVFSSILSGCDFESGGVSNAKMCMMLSQTFYFSEHADGSDDEERSKRVYVKNRLIGHPLWLENEFWDQVLFQCLSESLTNSGVMSNFERQSKNKDKRWREGRKIQWYDLTPVERTEAASQVHAIVFGQLGSLAHSMIEFGCGLERSCAFVRRMAIRNQLPQSQRTILLQHLVERTSERVTLLDNYGAAVREDEPTTPTADSSVEEANANVSSEEKPDGPDKESDPQT